MDGVKLSTYLIVCRFAKHTKWGSSRNHRSVTSILRRHRKSRMELITRGPHSIPLGQSPDRNLHRYVWLSGGTFRVRLLSISGDFVPIPAPNNFICSIGHCLWIRSHPGPPGSFRNRRSSQFAFPPKRGNDRSLRKEFVDEKRKW